MRTWRALAEEGMCIDAGNGIAAGTPFDNIAAFLDESARYGMERRLGSAKKRIKGPPSHH